MRAHLALSHQSIQEERFERRGKSAYFVHGCGPHSASTRLSAWRRSCDVAVKYQ
jgi:hypothetical protein